MQFLVQYLNKTEFRLGRINLLPSDAVHEGKGFVLGNYECELQERYDEKINPFLGPPVTVAGVCELSKFAARSWFSEFEMWFFCFVITVFFLFSMIFLLCDHGFFLILYDSSAL